MKNGIQQSSLGSQREVVRCCRCALNQFMTVNGKCRRCRYELKQPAQDAVEAAKEIADVVTGHKSYDIGAAVKLLRAARGYSQEDYAFRACVMRTYVSKVERGETIPTLRLLNKLAQGLGIPIQALVRIASAFGTGAAA